MFTRVKTVRLNDYGQEVAEWHEADGISLADVVAALDAKHPHSLVEARYVR